MYEFFTHTFMSKKNRVCLIVLLERITRKLVRFNISFDKDHETIQKIIDSSPKAKQYYFDGYIGYLKLNYHGGKYKSLNNKSQTHNIGVKCVNSDFRKYIPFFSKNLNVFQDL